MIKYHENLIQGSEEWKNQRCGMLTASEMENIITPKTLKPVSKKDPNDLIDHAWELLSQRISGYVEPQYISDAMLRGKEDEVYAREYYTQNYAPVQEIGFVTNDDFGFTIGYSPDGLVGDDGLIEVKSRAQKFQVETILNGTMPDDFRIQVQTGLLVTGRKWCDFISYSGGLPMFVTRVLPDPAVHDAIINAARAFEGKLAEKLAEYQTRSTGLIKTERRIREAEMTMQVGETT